MTLIVENLTVTDGVKNLSFKLEHTERLAFFSNEGINSENLLLAFGGAKPITEGKIIINNENVTYGTNSYERKMVYVDFLSTHWNYLFNVNFCLKHYVRKNKPFLEEISNHNKKIRAQISSLKNTGLSMDRSHFKDNVLKTIFKFIEEMEKNRNELISEYENQILNFHQHFIRENFYDPSLKNLGEILLKKFVAEEYNNIANNNLIFLQTLQDSLASLINVSDDCNCIQNIKPERRKDFALKEMPFILKEVSLFLDEKIVQTRKEVHMTLKNCNGHAQSFDEEFNRLFKFRQISLTRGQIDDIVDHWVDLAEVYRIRFNMKQDFVAMNLLPDEMHLLIKKIKALIESFHDKLKSDPVTFSQAEYKLKLHDLVVQLVDYRDEVNQKIVDIFHNLKISALLRKFYHRLLPEEKRLMDIIKNILVSTDVLLLKEPFYNLNLNQKENLARWLKALQSQYDFFIIFTGENQSEIDMLASHIIILENELVIQFGQVNEVTEKPLSLTLLKELNNKHLNESKGQWNNISLYFYETEIWHGDKKFKPVIAFKPQDVYFSAKKPRFGWFKNFITTFGKITHITNINEKEKMISFKTTKNEIFEVVVLQKMNLRVGLVGWIIFPKNSLYVFDSEKNNLIGTW